jgi:hypothetical protein
VTNDRGRVLALLQLLTARGPDRALDLLTRDPDEAHRVHLQLSWRDWFSGQGDRWGQRDRLHPPIRRLHLSAPYVSSIDGTAFVSVSVPLRDPDDPKAGPVGVLEAAIDLDELNRWMRGFELASGGFLAVFDRRWHGLEHHQRDRIRPRPQQPAPTWEPAPTLRDALAESSRGTLPAYRDPVDGRDYLAGYAQVEDPRIGWVVLVQHDREAVLTPLRKLDTRLDSIRWQAYIMATVVTVGLWGWLFWLLRRQGRVAPA